MLADAVQVPWMVGEWLVGIAVSSYSIVVSIQSD